MIGGVQNIGRITELRQRILFTFGMLAVYRVGAFIVTPGIDPAVVRSFFEQMEGTVFGLFTMFSGGALEQLSIFSLGIMPYISASIIFQLLTVVIPALEELKKEGEQGQRKINQFTRYATIGLALFQSGLIAVALERGQFGEGAVLNPGWGFRIMCMITLTSGTAFIMWLGEQITERGIGNGISMVIFASIIISIPSALGGLLQLIRTDQFTLLGTVLLLVFIVGVIGFVVVVERGQRRIPIQHARRVVGKKVTQGGMSYFPLRVNTAGVIPPIFASSILMFPATIAQFFGQSTDPSGFQRFLQALGANLGPGQPVYVLLYAALIIFFCFFYTALMYNSKDTADNLKKAGAFLPGIRPGAHTAEYIDKVLTRLTFWGAIYIAGVCLLPEIVRMFYPTVPFNFGGTSLLILVVVTMDFMSQMQAHAMSHQYEGMMQKANLRNYGRGGQLR